MKIGVAKETRDGETRVTMVPELVGKLTALGYEVAVEPDAGKHALIADEEFVEAGATIDHDAIGSADVVLSVQPLPTDAVRRLKRGGAISRVPLDEAAAVTPEQDIDLVALDEALERLAVLDARKSRLVELRFFGGMNTEEAAEVLGVATATVKRDWSFAKAWLLRELSKGETEGDSTSDS